MSIECYWDNQEHTVARIRFKGRWTLDQLKAAKQEIVSMLASVPHRVDVIVDMRKASMPAKEAMTSAQGFIDRSVMNQGVSVVIAAPMLVQIVKVFQSIDPNFKEFVRLAASEEEAYAVIEAERQTSLPA